MATATNVYLMLYPKPALAKVLLDKPELLKEVWQALDRISDETLMGEVACMGVDCISWNRGNWVMRAPRRFLRFYPN